MSLVSARRCLKIWRNSQNSRLPLEPIAIPNLHDHRAYSTTTGTLPRVARPSVWHSIIPKAFRKSESSNIPAKAQRGKKWNPATFFIWIFLLIGSNAIQMITLRSEYSSFSRKADAKIRLLKEVLDKVQRGEKVDVEKVLGTGDPEQEQEWHDVIKNIEEEDRLWQSKDQKREERRLKKEQAAASSWQGNETASPGDEEPELPNSSLVKSNRPPGFY